MVKGNQYIFPNQGVEVLKNSQKRSVKGDYRICGLGPRSCCKDNPSECSVWRHDTIYKIIENSDHLEENWLKYSEITFLFISRWISPPKFVPVTVLSFFQMIDIEESQGFRVPFQKITLPQGSKSPPTSLTQLLKSWTCCVQMIYTLET